MAQKFTLEITLGNDAMKDSQDLARALHRIARKVDIEGINFKAAGGGYIIDDNGNEVGTFIYE